MSFGEPRSTATARAVVRIALALGEVAVPCCARELASRDQERRAWARTLLRAIADDHVDRVRREARAVADRAEDDAKVDALALLAELGDLATARFDDPGAMQARSARQLAGHLTSPDRVASAASLVLDELPPEAIVELVATMADAAPDAAERLAGELTGRVEVAPEVRSAVRRVIPPRTELSEPVRARRTARPALLVVAVDPRGRAVVTVGRRAPGGRRCRGWSVLIGDDGMLDDAWYDDDASAQRITDDVIAPLIAQGFAVVAASPGQARTRVALAARAAVDRGRGLPPGYYLGRDLLALGDEHVRGRPVPDDVATALDRAVGLFAAGDPARARLLLEHCAARTPEDPIVASNLGLVLAALGEPAAARPWLERAAGREPTWALHHWNLAAILHRLGDGRACHAALRAFLACPGADDPARVAHARALCAEFARQRRLAPRRTRRR